MEGELQAAEGRGEAAHHPESDTHAGTASTQGQKNTHALTPPTITMGMPQANQRAGLSTVLTE